MAPAAAVVALFVLAALAGPLALSPSIPGPSGLSKSASPSAAISPIASKSTPTACSSGGHGSPTSASGAKLAPAAAPASPAARASLSPDQSPLFNSQVVPYAVLTGPYAYVAKGAALRDQGYGLINLTWPGSSTSNLVAAYMIWSEMNNSVPPSYGTLNGVNVTGTWTAYATPSPCWSQTYIYTFVAEVTSDVVNGINNLTNFPSSLTNGYDPWNQTETGILDEGVSLIAIYDTGSRAIQQITVYSGALTSEGATLSAQLNYSTANRTGANTTYIVADGQLPGNEAEWNGTVIDTNAFPGSDPKESPYTWSYGNLSDTKTYAVNVTAGANNTTAAMFPTDGDCFTWVGQVVDVGVPALPPPYKVTFQEQGLPNGATWNVTTNGTTHTGTVVSGTSSLSFKVLNGTYSYSASPVTGYSSIALKGSYTIAGGPAFLRIPYHEILYPITFNETGIPPTSYLSWTVGLNNTSQALEVSGSATVPLGIVFGAPNGTYNFTVSDSGLYVPEPANGTVTVNGGGVSESILFVPPPLYNITFQEQYLAPGTSWGADVSSNWAYFTNTTSSDSFTLQLPNATYGYDYVNALAVAGYQPPTSFYFTVTGAPETVLLNYSLLYPVYLNETGLPTGTSWSAYLQGITGETTGYSTNSTIEWAMPNGSYEFYVIPVWAYDVSPISGDLTVNGAFANASVVFTLAPTYLLQFNETGLPTGTTWSVSLTLPTSAVVTVNSTATTLSFEEPNGSYAFTVGAVAGFEVTPTYGYPDIDGAAVYEPVVFSAVYPVTFTETGLPSGTDWDVLFADFYNYTDTPTMGFLTPNGTYSYYVYSVGTFIPTPQTGSLTVNGTGLTVSVVFSSTVSPTYTVTFTETGLPASTNWSITLNYYTEATTGSTLNFTEDNGSYPFSVGGGIGYVASPASGTLNVSGKPASQSVAFSIPTGLYLVSFTEFNLPNGATWFVNITGQPGLVATVEAGSGHSVSTSLLNNTYTFTAATSAKGWSTTAGGQFTVNGGPVLKTVSFTGPPPATYEVTFVEKNLPSGVTWFINISGQSPLSATVSSSGGTQVSVNLTNASYTYAAATNSKDWTASGGTVTVNGAAQEVTVTFSNSGNVPPPSSSSSSPALPWTWIAVAILALAALLLIFFLIYRRRKKEEKPGTSTTPGAGPGAASTSTTPPPPKPN